MYLFILPVKHARWPGLLLWASLCSETTEQKNKESEKERRMKHSASRRSLRISGLPLTLYIWLFFFIFLGSHSSPCSHLLYDNPLHPPLQSYNQFNLWPWILQAPLTSKPVASDVENTLIHPYLIVSEIWKVWNKLRAWFTYQCSSDHGQVWLSHPVRVDRYGDIISWPIVSKSAVLAPSYTWVTVSWERADCVQKIKSHNAANYLTAPSPLSAGILIMMSWVISVLGVNFDWKQKTLHHYL